MLIFFPLLEDVGGFGLYWACGIKGDGNERKQKGRSGQMSGGGMAESYIGFGCGSTFWMKRRQSIVKGKGRASRFRKVLLRFLFFVFFFFKLC